MAAAILVRLLDALLIVFIGFILARITGRLVRAALQEIDIGSLARKVGFRVPLERPISIAVEVTLAVIVIALAFFRLGILREVVFAIVSILGVGILLAIALSIRDTIPNIVAAVAVPRQKLAPGSRIRIGTLVGTVAKQGLFDLELETRTGDRLDVPLAYIWKEGLA
jgi:small-conductance mechanosensitive channel